MRECADLLEGRVVDDEFIVVLGGPHALAVLAGREGGREGYWPRVWAARGLLHAWSDEATESLVRSLRDDAWRVREMATKVVAAHLVGDALDAVVALRADPVLRVRTAAERALVRLTSSRA